MSSFFSSLHLKSEGGGGGGSKSEGKFSPFVSEDEEVVDSRMPGGGSMYYCRRVERKGADGKTRKYVLTLGAGGFAATLDGVRIIKGERVPVALKVVSMNQRAAEAFEKSEMRGIETLTGRSHPALVSFIGYFKGEDGDGNVVMSFAFERCPTAMPYLVEAMTSAKGFLTLSPTADIKAPTTLSGCDLLHNPILQPCYSVFEARHVCRQILSALAYLHGLSPPLIHRDVKPGNVLVWKYQTQETIPPSYSGDSFDGDEASRLGGRPRVLLDVKLTDYGTLRAADTRDLTVSQGTKSFMAPEVDKQTGMRHLKATGSYDTFADIFSAGATFFYLVTGQTPDSNTKKNWDERLGRLVTVVPRIDPRTGRDKTRIQKDAIILGSTKATDGLSLFENAARKAEDDDRLRSSGAESPSALASPGSPVVTGSTTNILDFYFPAGSKQSEFLYMLVRDVPGRVSAKEALEWLDTNWP
jgi:serine/threonine protein kinase